MTTTKRYRNYITEWCSATDTFRSEFGPCVTGDYYARHLVAQAQARGQTWAIERGKGKHEGQIRVYRQETLKCAK